MLLFALAMPWTAKAQSGNITFTDTNVVVTIGDEASNYTYANMPVVMYYNYSLTQQIYTAAELGNTAGIITSIAFDYAYTEPFSMAGMKVYMKNINKTSFDSDTDMVDLSDATMVYDGSFAASEAGWVTLQLQTPFFYNGTSNLLLCCYDPTNGYPGYDYKFRSTPADGPYCYLSYFGDNAIPDLNDISFYSASKFRDIHRNNIRLTFNTNIQSMVHDDFPYVDDFTTLNEWQLINGNLTNQWVWGEAGNRGDPHIYISDNNGISNHYTNTSPAMVYAAKLFRFEEGWYRFQYDWLAYGESNYDYLRVALVPASVTLSAGTSAPSGFSYNSLPSGWIALDGGQQLSMNAWWQTTFSEINVPAGDYMMVFAWRNDNSMGSQPPAAIDNVSIRPVSCLAPVGLTAQHVGRTQVTLDWTPVGNEDEWEVWLSWPNGNETWSMPYTATTHPFTISGLGAGVTYTATVNAKCGPDNTSYASNEISFTTSTDPCDNPATFPFTENFDGYAGSTSASVNILPDCWSRINTTTVSSQQGCPTILQASYAQSAPNFLYFLSSYVIGSYEDPQDQYAILPPMDHIDHMELSLYARSNTTFMVGVMTDPTDAGTFTELATCQPSPYTYTQYSIPLDNYTGDGWYIAIKMPAASSDMNERALFIDDVSVNYDPLIYSINPDGVSVTVTGHMDGTNATGQLIIPETKTIDGVTYTVTAIGDDAFNNCEGLTGSLTIPNTVTTIGNWAFSWCKSLSGSLILGNSLTEIGEHAFNNCNSLTGSLTIPNSVTAIGDDAFVGCGSLTGSLTLGNSLTSIGISVFGNCGFTGSLTIPNSVNSIGANAFSGCSGFTSLSLGNSVTEIGSWAFAACTHLTTVTVQATTPPTLGEVAFLSVSNTIPVYVPCGSLVDYQAASGWSYFTNIQCIVCSAELPLSENFDSYPGVTSGSENVLPDCWSRINTTTVSSQQGYPTIFQGSYAQSAPNFLYFMSTYAVGYFEDPQDQYAILPPIDNVSDLVLSLYARIPAEGRNATFMVGVMTDPEDASTFTELVTLQPTSTTYTHYSIPLGNYTGNGWYIAIKMPAASSSVNYRGLCIDDVAVDHVITFADPAVKALCVASSTGWDTNGDGELSYAEAEAVTSLDGVFSSEAITSFNELQYFTGLEYLDDDAFYWCDQLTSVIIPSSVTEIGGSAFSDCSSLTSVTIPSSVTHIGESAFSDCSSLTSVTIPSSVTSIGSNAFNGSGLTEMTVEATTPPTLGNNAFQNVPTDIPVYVPCNTKAAYQAASGWSDFTNIIDLCDAIVFADANVKAICVQHWDTNGDGELSYGEAAAVTTLKPSGAENSVFWNTEITSFDELQYFTGLTSIEENAFMFCNSLTSVTLPNAVTSIGSYAFAHCISLTSVSLPNSLTTIGDFAFTNATSLSTIELPLSLMGIGARAFDNCGLVSVVIPASVMGIGINPFTYCSSLTSITVDGPSNVFYTPNDNALVNSQTQTLVTGLSTTIIPNTVTTIGAFAFDGCINLTSITIPNTVTYIDNLAFHYCIGLTSITVEATTPPTLGNDVFQAIPVDIPVYVPCESLDAYQDYNNTGSPWGGFTNIKTLNEHFPWTEDFENYAGLNNNNTNYNTMPSCWSSIHGANPAQNYYDRYPSVYTYSSYAHSGSNFIFFADNYNTDYTHSDQYAILPPVENVNQMTLSLYALKEYRTAYFEVGVMTDPDDASTFTMVGSATATTTHTLYSFSFANYTGTGTYIAIRMPKATSGNNRGVCIDDVTLDHIITFADPAVKAICVQNWDTNGDNELSYAEAAAVTSLGQVFQNAFQAEGTIVTFDELQYFTGLTSINDNAFAGCWRLSSITLPPHVGAIGNNAFGMCSALTSITLPNTVTSIGDNAFQYCMNMTTIEFPDALTTIGSRTFDYCLGLTSVEIPASVTSIGLNPFTGCNNLASITVAEGNTVYSSPNNNALVETATHKLVSGLNNTVIPDDIQIIGNFAFNGLYGLTSLVIPASVTDIYYEAFGNCSNLAELTVLATTPPTLGNNAFFNVPTTIPVYVPCGTKAAYQAAAGWNAFTNIVDLCDVIVFADANVKAICVQNWDTNGDGELSYGEAAAVTTLIPDGASNSAFRNTTITSFNELQYFTGLSSIETLAFHHCTSLTSVIIPSGVDSIGVNPFSYCPALESITVMAGNTVYDSRGNCNAIIETATNTLKAGCKNTVIPSEVTSIASGAFDYCTSLLSITIPSGVAFIDNYVFNQCSGLTSITVEATTPPTANSSTFIGVPRNIPVYVPCNTKAAYQAASGWSNFINIIDFCDAIVFADANVKAICVQNWDTNGDGELSYAEAAAVTSLGQVFQNAFQEEGTNVTFNELQYFTGLTSIGANAFAGCWRLTSVTLPPTVTTIGSNAFTMCSGLASSPITNHVTEIGDYAFNYCYSLTEIELPSSVTSIGNRAFDRCYYLTSVVIPASVTSIGINPFSGCTRLASIVVDEGNTVYGSPNGCNAIINTEEHLLVSGCNNTNIPDGVQTIGWYAFLASGLTTLTIPTSVNSIADYAFSECEALSELTLLATTPPTLEGTDVFSYINLDIPVNVPCESLEAYQTYNNGQPWGGFTNIRCDVCSAELPLSENFESYQGTTSGATNVLPDCWDRINTAVDIAYTGYPTILNEPANAYSGSNYLRFHYNQGYGSEQYVILPYVDNIAEVSLWFYAKALTENAAIFVGVMTDPNDVSTFETAFEIDNLTSDYQQCNVSIDSEYINDQTHYIAIKSGANNGATQCDLCIDNLELLRITQQNLTLSEGWNWWTPTVRTYRSALQYALGSNGIIINSQDQGFQKNNGNYWSGTLPGVLEPGQMYKIKTNASVSATLQGLEVAQPTITIVAGYNWFGYTGAQAADITTALGNLGITPASGDIITDKDGNTATYNGNYWSGTLTTLQPGHGYVYRRQ